MEEHPASGLKHLAKAPSKKLVEKIFTEVFRKAKGDLTSPPQNSPLFLLVESLKEALKLSGKETVELIESIRYLEKICVYENSSNVSSLLPSDLNEQLAALILEILNSHLVEFRKESLASQPSLPKLKQFDWRIDVKRASESVSVMSVPTVLVQLQTQTPSDQLFGEPVDKAIAFELNKQLLETMVDGLSKIRSQLSALK
eukprot:TRINITY_DN5259_c0_g1_i1.p1 TRINITY_DN5259_c0_g1~~TRINITY_DN5259_c0_g1_i1.p1  ORF type:complete len:200 (-),score=61.44 TRINITY_DN5259_c0_g1_i1:36-635(-)